MRILGHIASFVSEQVFICSCKCVFVAHHSDVRVYHTDNIEWTNEQDEDNKQETHGSVLCPDCNRELGADSLACVHQWPV